MPHKYTCLRLTPEREQFWPTPRILDYNHTTTQIYFYGAIHFIPLNFYSTLIAQLNRNLDVFLAHVYRPYCMTFSIRKSVWAHLCQVVVWHANVFTGGLVQQRAGVCARTRPGAGRFSASLSEVEEIRWPHTRSLMSCPRPSLTPRLRLYYSGWLEVLRIGSSFWNNQGIAWNW